MSDVTAEQTGAASAVIPHVGLRETGIEGVEASSTQGPTGWSWSIRNHAETC